MAKIPNGKYGVLGKYCPIQKFTKSYHDKRTKVMLLWTFWNVKTLTISFEHTGSHSPLLETQEEIIKRKRSGDILRIPAVTVCVSWIPYHHKCRKCKCETGRNSDRENLEIYSKDSGCTKFDLNIMATWQLNKPFF